MTAKPEIPVTPAVRALRAAGIEIVPHFYPYLERGGTRHAAESLGIPEHEVVKTLVFESPAPLLVLQHGDREVSTRQLARILGVKTIAPASPAAVEKHTGYQPGGVSPFGTRKPLPVYIEEGLLAVSRFYINGGKRGFLVEVAPVDLQRILKVTAVQVGIEG